MEGLLQQTNLAEFHILQFDLLRCDHFIQATILLLQKRLTTSVDNSLYQLNQCRTILVRNSVLRPQQYAAPCDSCSDSGGII